MQQRQASGSTPLLSLRASSQMHKFGGHSFSIRTPDGRIVYDGGSLLSMRIQSVSDLQVVAKAALQH